MTVDTSKPTSRRAVLGAALGGAAAVGIHALASAPGVRAADGGNLILGSANSASSMTGLAADLAAPAFAVTNTTTDGTAVAGTAASGVGIAGSTTTGNGVTADASDVAGYGLRATNASTGAAVWAASGDSSGAQVQPNTDETGVYGYCDISDQYSAGVWGDSNQSAGVVGTGSTGVVGLGPWGVYGYSSDPTGIAIAADAGTATTTALHVNGRAHFSQSGKGSFTKTQATKSFSAPGVTSASMVLATIQANKSGLYVRGAVAGSNKVTIYLSKKPGATVRVAWLAVS